MYPEPALNSADDRSVHPVGGISSLRSRVFGDVLNDFVYLYKSSLLGYQTVEDDLGVAHATAMDGYNSRPQPRPQG